MPFEIQVGKFSGMPDSKGWSQIYEFTPQDSEKLEKRGRLFAVISASNFDTGSQEVLVGREILSRLHEEYFGNLQGSSFDRLKYSIKRVSDEFSEIEGFKLQMAAACLLNEFIYLACVGGARVDVLRDDLVFTIIESNAKEPVTASGYQRRGDLIILATKAFFQRISEGVIRGSFRGKDPGEILELIIPKIRLEENGGDMGVLLIKFKEEIKKEKEFFLEEELNEKIFFNKGLEGPSFEGVLIGDFSKKGKSFKGKIKDFFQGFSRINIYVKREEVSFPPKRKTSVFVGFFLFLFLLASIFFGIKRKKEIDLKKSYEDKILSAQHEIQESHQLLNLNPQRSRELLYSAREKVFEIQENIKDGSLDELKEKIKRGEEEILKEFRQDAEIFFDLSLIDEGFKGDEMVAAGSKLFVFDKRFKKIVGISSKTKRTEIIGSFAEVLSYPKIASYLDRVFLVDSEGVTEVGRGKVIEGSWDGEALPYVYASNFYILEKKNSKIYKFQGLEKGFGEKKEWLSQDLELDLTNSFSWSIDGSIWVLVSDGEILKFSSGYRQSFKPSGVYPEISNPKQIFTNEATKYLYILEPEKKRIIVLDKSGEYKAQYLSDELKDALNFVVFENEGKIIFLNSSGKLFLINLRYL